MNIGLGLDVFACLRFWIGFSFGFFYAVNGWFKVWVALIDKMTIGSRFYLVAFLLTALLSYIFYDNVVHLSVSITLMMTAMTCYSYFIGMNKKY